MKNKMLSLKSMIRLEKWVDKQCSDITFDTDPKTLLDSLHLNIKWTYPGELPKDTEVELCPSDDKNYNGLIRVDSKMMNTKFAYMHEVVHYLMDVGRGNKVERVFTRKSKGKTTDEHEQDVNYATAAILLPREYMQHIIYEYDTVKPKMDELRVLAELCKKSGLDKKAVLRRWHEVRVLTKYEPLLMQ